MIVAEPISSRSTDGLASAIRQRIVDACGLPVGEVLLVEKGTITRNDEWPRCSGPRSKRASSQVRCEVVRARVDLAC